LAAILIAASAAAGSPLHIAAGKLGPAILALGEQAGVSVGLADTSLAELPTPAVDGRFTATEALRRLLKGLPARVIPIDPQTFRIVRERPHPHVEKPPRPVTETTSPQAVTPDILVTASKRGTGLGAYPGTATVLGTEALAASAPGGSDAILSQMPALSSTQLGPGRNKLFIGGIADSSFNGPTQATVGQYLGELRLNYNAPDPDLALYDVSSVEVIEGPQGTLYGAGSLGGIIRIEPKPVRLDHDEGTVIAGLGTAAHGEPDSDIAGMLNLPLVNDRLGVRILAYRKIDGGYIDDAERDLSNVNRTRAIGGRGVAAAALGPWSVEATLGVQYINSKDGQYAERGLPALTKRDAIAQPFDNDYLLAGVVARRNWGGLDFVSATGLVSQEVDARYDFTVPGEAARAFEQDNNITLISNETRLSLTRPNGAGWLVGASFLFDSESLTRTLGSARITGVRNDVTEGAVYGELTLPVVAGLLLTGGGRVSFDHLSGQALDLDNEEAGSDVDSGQLRMLPSIALSWRRGPATSVFLRYEEGYRPGGLSVAGEEEDGAVRRFRGDSVGTVALGARLTRHHWAIAATLSSTRWENIQADLIDGSGLPFTANLGRGAVRSAEIRIEWQPVGGLSLDAAIAANDSELDHPDAAFAAARGGTLPNIPDYAGRVGLSWEHPLSGTLALTASGWARYVGRSRLGIGPALDIGQGNYIDDDATLRVGTSSYGVTLSASNIADARGNRFALGNPFTVAERKQITPLRPRTIRIGFDAHF
jgi:iron complex outermembrane recepter protein